MAFHESEIVASIADIGLRKTFDSFTNVNNSRILSMRSSDGWDVVHERALIFDTLIKYWFGGITSHLFKENPPFEYSLVAVGGYGRKEMNPNSDVDIKFLVDDRSLQENPLVQTFTREAMYSLEEECGFTFEPIVHHPDDLQGLAEKFLNTFLDMRHLCGSEELTHRVRERLRAQYDPLELFLHNAAFLQDAQRRFPESFDRVDKFNIKSGVGGLRNVHAATWMQASEKFDSSETVYQTFRQDESLWESVGILLQMRSWLNLHKEKKRKFEALEQKRKLSRKSATDRVEADTFRYEDFQALKEAFGESALERLGFARRVIFNCTQAKIHERIGKGIELDNEQMYGSQGLSLRPGNYSPREKNERMFALVRRSQRSAIPISPAENLTTFQGAYSWSQPCPAFGRLFFEKGSLFETLTFLSDRHVLDRVIPGYTHLRVSMHDSNHRARNLTRAGFALQKVKTLEALTADSSEYPDLQKRFLALSPDYAAGLKLALFVKRIPYVDDTMQGVIPESVEDYLKSFSERIGFPEEAREMAQFLIQHHNLLRRTARENLPDEHTVQTFLHACPDLAHLNALLLFTYADHGQFDRGETRHFWQSIDELVRKSNAALSKEKTLSYNPLDLDASERAIAQDLGPDFMSGRYASGTATWVSYLRRVQKTGKPIVKPHFYGDSQLLGVACHDYKGLLAVITGNLFESGTTLRQAHAYSLSHHGLALDYFDVVPSEKPLSEIAAILAEAIEKKKSIQTNPQSIFSALTRIVELEYQQNSKNYRLSFKTDRDTPGILYALTRVLHEQLKANIHGMSAYAFKGRKVEDYIFFSTPFPEEEARHRVEEYIGILTKR